MFLWNKVGRKDLSNGANLSASQKNEDTLENLPVSTQTGSRASFAYFVIKNQDPSSNFCGLFNLSKNESPEDLNIELVRPPYPYQSAFHERAQ
jgi:hypothetical protein